MTREEAQKEADETARLKVVDAELRHIVLQRYHINLPQMSLEKDLRQILLNILKELQRISINA